MKNNPLDYGAVVLQNPASSARTSRPIIPAAAKKINWKPNTTNFDMGGGKYEKLTEFLRAKGIENRVYDQFNRSAEHNSNVLRKGMTDTGSLFNVLNVIPDEAEMTDALRVLKQMVRGAVVISVYEGDGSGRGKTTRDGFQHNKKLEYYLPIVRKVFPDAKRMGIIIAANYTSRNPREMTSDQEMWLEDYYDNFVENEVRSAKARDIYNKYSQYKYLGGKWRENIPEIYKSVVNSIQDRAIRAMTDEDHEEFNRLGNVRRNPHDACYSKVKARYKVWPSAYASGALVQCRKVGAENWGIRKNPDFGLEKKYGLHGWFMRNRGKGWVDCKTGKPCGRKKGEKRKYPACRPTKAMCTSAAKKKKGKRIISWNPVPPAEVARAAKRGLLARKKYHRGGTAVGVARARDLSRRANVSQKTIDRMYSYFSRHRASRAENAKRISDPTSAARIADDLWGGSAGFRWARKVRENPAKTIKAYHGSNENFNSFSKEGKGTYDDSLGFFFTSSKFDAGFYGDIVYSVSLSFENPYIVKWSDITEELGGDRQLSPWSFGMKTLISKGYDSAIVMADAKSKKYGEEYDDHEFQYNQYIAFNPSQIRILKKEKAT